MESDKRGEGKGLEDSNLVNQNDKPLSGEWEADPG